MARSDSSINLLAQQELFNTWTRTRLERMYNKSSILRAIRNQTIFQAGDDSNHIYIVKSGTFKFSTNIDNNKNLKYCDLSIQDRGQMFGYEDVLNERPRSFSCHCLSPSGELIMMHKTVIQNFFSVESNDALLKLSESKDRLR